LTSSGYTWRIMGETSSVSVRMKRTDEELVALATAGDPESFNQLVGRWEHRIFALAYRVIGREDDAKDVCQETFLRAFRGIKKFEGKAKFSSWLYRIALNLCRDWLRRDRRSAVIVSLENEEQADACLFDDKSENAERHVVRRDMQRVLGQAMSLLTEDQRATIVLKEFHGLTFQAIADLQGCPLSTVKTRLYQGLSIMRRKLEKEGVTNPLLVVGQPKAAGAKSETMNKSQ